MARSPQRRFLFAVPLAAALWFAAAGAASAEEGPFGWRVDEISSSTNEAGGHPEIKIALATSTDTTEQGLESVKIAWPDGLVPAVGESEYCELEQDPEDESYRCANPDAEQIGSQTISYATTAVLQDMFHRFVWPFTEETGTLEMGTYLERPGAEEAARLVSLPADEPAQDEDLPAIAFESSAVLRSDGSGVDMTMKGLPYTLPAQVYEGDYHTHTTLHISRIETTMRGGETTASGKPVLTIPATCDPVSFKATFTSYGEDGYADTGDELTASQTSPFPITGCEEVPYRPSTSLALTSPEAGATTSLSAETTLPQGDAPPKELAFYLPQGFTLSPKEDATLCSQAKVSAFACQGSSAIGTFTATSTLTDTPLQGSIHRVQPQGEAAGIAVLARSAFGDIDLSGKVRQTPAGGTEIAFPGIPPLGVRSVRIDLDKGAGGALQNPYACGTYYATSTSISHTGKKASATQPLSISGCKGPKDELSLAVKLWKNAPNRFTDIRFDVAQEPAKAIGKATFYLPKEFLMRLPFSKDKPLAYVELWATDKAKRGTLYQAKRSGRSLLLKARNSRLKGLTLRLDRDAARMTIEDIPEGMKLSDLSVRLFGKRTHLVRTFKSCPREESLAFKVAVEREGRTGEATDRVKVRCKRGQAR